MSVTPNTEALALTPVMSDKLSALRALLSSYERVVVAFSGGVDSAFLAKVAHDTLKDAAQAFTARSPSLMQVELDEATALARSIGIAHQVVETHELERSGYTENGLDRCYHCKAELFDATAIAASKFGDAVVVDGFNLDDFTDHRPGHQAASERQVRHPLAEVQLGKDEIRALSRHLGLSTWSKPQLACLSSRVPYGTRVTPKRLARIEHVEMALRAQEFFDVRARLVPENEDMVRIELGAQEIARLMEPSVRDSIVEAAKRVGFRFITLDLEGFRSGRMNESEEGLIQIGLANED